MYTPWYFCFFLRVDINFYIYVCARDLQESGYCEITCRGLFEFHFPAFQFPFFQWIANCVTRENEKQRKSKRFIRNHRIILWVRVWSIYKLGGKKWNRIDLRRHGVSFFHSGLVVTMRARKNTWFVRIFDFEETVLFLVDWAMEFCNNTFWVQRIV